MPHMEDAMLRYPMRVVFALILFTLLTAASESEDPAAPPQIQYGEPRQLAVLADRNINESSGLARSFLNQGAFWTHNDSGDVPRVFLIDQQGQTLATLLVEGAEAIDWEDMASFRHGDNSYLLIADVGDNDAEREVCTLYTVAEPKIERTERPPVVRRRPSMTVRFSYEDGPHNCESVAVDPVQEMIYLVTKLGRNECKVYTLPFPEAEDAGRMIARSIATLTIRRATAMDISSDGSRAVVLRYRHAREYERRAGETWADAFSREGRVLTMPRREQGEAICYGPDGKTLYLTSEGVSQPLWEVPVVSE